MTKYVLKRVLAIIPLILLVTAVCFAFMHLIPGGPEGVLSANPKITPDDLARIRSNFGLDRPLIVQYGHWLERVVFHADFGMSYVTGEPVAAMIGRRLPATLELMGSAFLLALLAALAVGVISVLKNNTAVDSVLTVGSLAVISVPVFWLALMSMMLFSVRLGVLPSAGMSTVGAPFSIIDHLRHLVLPTLVLSIVLIASWSRYMRETLLEAMSADHIDVARAKGLPSVIVLLRHGLRNAAGPVVTVVAMSVPILFTGSVVVETIFSWPGMGRLFYEGLLRHDYTRLMGIVLVSSFLVALFNLLADCLYGIFDPRIRYAR